MIEKWSDVTWRTLFGVDTSVCVLDESESIKNDGQAIVVLLPLGKDPKERLIRTQ